MTGDNRFEPPRFTVLPNAASRLREEESPLVSLLVPCRNEEKFIGSCLESIVANDYPKDRLEVFVMDGLSEDKTWEIASEYARRYPFIRLLKNARKITSAAFNTGLEIARGEAVILIGAHTIYPQNYISGLVEWLGRSGADSVGGICITRPIDDSPKAAAIALGLSHPFGVGNAYFRIRVAAPRWVDTVPFGCYRREVFDRIGRFDEDLARNQDDEFNFRLLKQGGRILLVPEIVSYYFARNSLKKLWRMYNQYGYFKPLVARKIGAVMTWRQLVPALFVLALVISTILAFLSPVMRLMLSATALGYGTAVVGVSAWVARNHGMRTILALAAVFPVLHLSYGVGFLRGVIDHLMLRRSQIGPSMVSISR